MMAINRYPAAWPAELHAGLKRMRSGFPHAHLYALIEGALDESCYPLLKRSARLPHVALYAGTPGADDEVLCLSPLLVEYREEQQRAWDRLMAKTDGRPALSIIATPEPLDALARRLAPWCVVDAAGYTLALSFADTRILPELFNVLTPHQRAQLCGPMLHWHYVARDASWAALPLAVSETPAAGRVVLDEKQCAQLTDAAEADNVLHRLRAGNAGLVDCHTPARAYASVRYWLACADHARIDTPSGRAEVCEFGLRHPALDASPELLSWLSQPASPHSFDMLRDRWLAGRA